MCSSAASSSGFCSGNGGRSRSVIWHVSNPAGRWLLHAVFWLGWAIVLLSTFLIDHFDLFGLRQVYLLASGRPYRPVEFKTPRPLPLCPSSLDDGFLIAFWAAPTMTAGHLLFAVATTAYILIASAIRGAGFGNSHGEQYRAYQQQVRMLLPIPKTRKS